MNNTPAQTEGDFRVEVRVRNARILRAMKARGIKTFRELASLAMVNPSKLGAILSFKEKPTANGEWSNAAFGISAALHVEPEDLWPEHMKHLLANKSFVSYDTDEPSISQASIASYVPPDLQIDLNNWVMDAIPKLSPREAMVIGYRFADGERTCAEIGEEMGVGAARIHQIERRAIQKLKHPSRMRRAPT